MCLSCRGCTQADISRSAPFISFIGWFFGKNARVYVPAGSRGMCMVFLDAPPCHRSRNTLPNNPY
jgi:hypothetical protein